MLAFVSTGQLLFAVTDIPFEREHVHELKSKSMLFAKFSVEPNRYY